MKAKKAKKVNKVKKLKRKKVLKDDGRYLIFYGWKSKEI